MASFSGPKLSNRIADDVPDIQAVLSSLAKLTPDSGNTDYPIGTKRVAETTNGYEFQQYNGTGWVTLEKWNLDAQKVDGYSASTGTTANTIPVRNANGKLPGDILGNAATATKANALSETNPIPMGGTGATTAEQARANLGTPPKTHASTSTEYGTGTSTQYGHLKSHDAPDATLTAATGHAFSPAGAASMKTELEEQIEEVETGASSQLSSLDASLRALIAQEVEKCLKLSGGVMTGEILVSNLSDFIRREVNNDRLVLLGGPNWKSCSYIELFGGDNTGRIQLNAKDGTNSSHLTLNPGEDALVNGGRIITSAGGTMTGSLLVSNILSGANNGFGLYGGNAWRTGGYIELGGPNHTNPNHIQINGGSRQVLEDLGYGWHIAGSPILTLVASWTSGANWYRKYSDGWIEQGGLIGARSGREFAVTFHTAFTNTNYTLTYGSSTGSVGNGSQSDRIIWSSRTTTGFTFQRTDSNATYASWYACGY